jgi:hypothetical protein
MNIPDFVHTKIANADGTPTEEHRRFLEQLTQLLKAVLSQNGTQMPLKKADAIALLNSPLCTGKVLYDNDNHQLMVNINGTFKTVQTS